jgi:thermostable 8-oxoguanine DNA glycosylase
MIDPNNITNFNRTETELEEFLLFCVLVAGKNSEVQAKKLQEFLGDDVCHPFLLISYLNREGKLEQELQKHKLGQYKRISKCFVELLKFGGKLKEVTFFDLIKVYGLGFKTANFFLLHSRKDYVGAVLDTHILTWMRNKGFNTPKSTPPPQKYLYWQEVFLDLCRELWPNISIAQIDLNIWKEIKNV